jgi:diguanylate cyclase (GGDEF)-like protein
MPATQRPTAAATLDAVSADDALQALTGAVQGLSLAERSEDVQRIVCSAARRLTGADAATLALRDGDHSLYVAEDAIEPLWRGDRFPLGDSISGWAMLNRRHVVIEDIYADRRIPHDIYRPTFVKSLVMAPIRTMDPLGAIGVYWARPHRATEREVGLVRTLADSTAVALEHVQTVDDLGRAREISETDPLTGLLNRRAWDRAFVDALVPGATPLSVALIALDHYSPDSGIPDPADDALLRAAADAWRGALRDDDLLARYAGEEFALLLPHCGADAGRRVAERLFLAVPNGETASIGLASWDGEEVGESLFGRAHAAMYEARAAARDCVIVAG